MTAGDPPGTSTPLVSLLLPNRNNDQILDLVLDRLATHTSYPHVELIAVDDGSTDSSRQILRRWRDEGRFRSFRLIEQPGSGVADALNVALRAATGEVCVQLDADASIETPGWLEQMLALLLIDERVGVVSAKVVMDSGAIHACGIDLISPEGLRDRPAQVTEAVGRRRWHWRVEHPPEGRAGAAETRVAEVDSGIGVCMMYRRADAIAVGGYDPGFAPVWFDDLDLCIAIRAAGKKVFCMPQVRLVHHIGARNPRSAAAAARPPAARLALSAAGRVRGATPTALRHLVAAHLDFGGPHTPEQQQRLRHHYAYWRSKWGWDLLNPDMNAIRDRWGDTEIWWAADQARRDAGQKIIASLEDQPRRI